MNENKYTPEPWSVDPDSTDYYASILDADGADTILLGDYEDWWMTKANARRIVACVNACAGIPTYQLTAENDNPTNLGEVIDAIRDQRDELLAALENTHNALKHFWPEGHADAIAAIARVKGEQ